MKNIKVETRSRESNSGPYDREADTLPHDHGHLLARETLNGPDTGRINRLKLFLDSVGGGAWPFLVGGVI